MPIIVLSAEFKTAKIVQNIEALIKNEVYLYRSLEAYTSQQKFVLLF